MSRPGERSPLRAKVLDALAAGRRDTLELAAITGIAAPGRILCDLLVERKVRRVGTRPSGRRPVVIWERVAPV